MDQKLREIRAEDINPRFNWGRALPALGIMGVDFEERVDYRRLHRYRLSRVTQALENSELGALLVFDVNNIRYITSTKIGEWERDKLSRWALLTRTGEPILWDFGSAAVHHKLYTPWLAPENCKAGLIGLRGTVDPASGRIKRHAEEIAALIREAGVAGMPIGVDIIEPPMLFELEKAGLKIADGRQYVLEAREIKSADEIALLNRAAAMSGIGTGGTITGIGEVIKPRKASFKLIAVEPAGSPILSGGQPGPHKLQGLGAGFVPAILNTKIYDEVITVKEDDSAPISKQVAKLDGIPVGISSGAAIWAAIQVAKRPENKGKQIVAIIPSSAERYLSSWLFADLSVESDSIDDLLPAAKA